VVRWFGGRGVKLWGGMNQNKNKKNILAVDDNITQLKIYESSLGSHYDLTPVKSATEALKIMDTISYDLILLDIEMPDVSGFEFLHQVRKNPRYMTTPIIIITSHSDPGFLSHAKNSSASGVLTKPVKPKQLISAIESAFAKPPKNPFGL
jgi:CheY-like chemotaxis protein